jgi:alpha-L-fucosidase
VKAFSVEARIDGTWTPLAVGTTIGAKRILKVQPTVADAVRVNIDDAKACPALETVGLYTTPYSSPQNYDPLAETQEQKDARMKWFREARFGMFIHWGLYSVPAGEWQGKDYDNAGEWLQYTAKIKPADYEPLQKQFNPVNFDAEKWVKIAKNAGMKYIVITSKHHEGFGMWPSAQGTWNIGHTQFHRDPLKELAAACRKEGLKLCFYHSIMDWHHPDYLPRRPWDDRPTNGDSMDAYVAYMKAQLKELLTNYGPIGILWFDGEWENTWTHERGVDLYKYIRTLQPNIIVNNRVDTGRSGNGSAVKENVGDYGTPEQTIPANGIPGTYWETCMTMNNTWGYHDTDHNWKSPETLIRNLVDIASKGGNYLLNVGPTSLGEIPPGSVDRLAAIGRWTKVNGEALYDTSASPFPKPLHWGRVTQRPGKLYLHVLDPSQQILLPGLKTGISRVYELAHPATVFEVTQSDLGPVVNLNGVVLPDKIDTVLVAQLEGETKIDPVIATSDVSGNIKLDATDAEIHGDTLAYEAAHRALGYWTQKGDYPSWDFRLAKPGEFNLVLEVACQPGNEGGTFEVTIGSQTVTGTVPVTKDWNTFVKLKLGPITLVTPGDYTVTVKPTKMGSALMNLRSVSIVHS